MANGINEFLQQLGAGTNIQDYKHATRLFVDSNYRLAPKYGFLFHVAFDINPELKLSDLTNEQILESGMLVKSAQLPKFTIDTKTFNAYNRPNVVQTKLKYDPLTITFHDDSADVLRYFWWNYYNHYYRDSDVNHTMQEFGQPAKYAERSSQNWGYTPRSSLNNGSVERMLTAIRIYSLHQRRFTEYTLINPTITGFKFGDHNYSGTSDVMGIDMSVAYESVMYNYGQVIPDNTVKGFGVLHYDKTPSPLTPQGGGTQSIFGPGGLTNALDSVNHQLGQGNFLGAGLTAFKSFQNFKGANFRDMATNELKTIGTNILNGSNPLAKIQIPSLGGLINTGGISNGGPSTFGVASGAAALSLFFSGKGSPNSPVAATQGSGVQYENIEQVTAQFSGASAATSNGDAVAVASPVAAATSINSTPLTEESTQGVAIDTQYTGTF